MRIDIKRVPYEGRFKLHIIEVSEPRLTVEHNTLALTAMVNRADLENLLVRIQDALAAPAAP